MHEEIGGHALWHVPVLGTLHSDTILTTWLVMLVTLPFFAWVGASYHSAFINKRQTILEGLINYVADLANGTIGPKGEPFVPFFIALGVFIFVLNEFGTFPFKAFGLPFGGSPTADLNTAVAYAVMIFVVIQVSGIRKDGFAFYKHLLGPFWPHGQPLGKSILIGICNVPLVMINVLEEVLRPTTLAARLFFNIFVGELLLYVIVEIITAQIKIGSFDLSMAAAVMPFFLEIFNFLVGLLQAFVFVLLSIVYLSLALADEH
ncbi:MAG TPA: F0F1 ATP synthase subunit A [Verrucomicrobiae bacterium]|nr:F0F1 ATP synthase subunit A [Verrucomicrobiae bacterium]